MGYQAEPGNQKIIIYLTRGKIMADSLTAKDYLYIGGIVINFILVVGNILNSYRLNKRTTFINTITNQRIKWLEQLRQDIATFCGLTYTWCSSELRGEPKENNDIKKQEDNYLKEIDKLRHLIRLRLDPEKKPENKHENKIEELIKEIPELTDIAKRKELLNALDELTKTSQLLLKGTWKTIKEEVESGKINKEKQI